MNPRRVVVEERVLSLADRLDDDGERGWAARLREVVPEDGSAGDDHVAQLRVVLADLQARPVYEEDCRRVLAAVADLPGAIGRRGRAWVAPDHPDGFWAYWEDGVWLEQGPTGVPLEEATARAAARSDDVRGPA